VSPIQRDNKDTSVAENQIQKEAAQIKLLQLDTAASMSTVNSLANICLT
jgi:hypothetical protein